MTTRLAATLDLPPFYDDPRRHCRGYDVRLFYPERDTNPRAAHDRALALSICKRNGGCPVLVECRAWAIENAEWGVWGGTTEGERDRIRNGLDEQSSKTRTHTDNPRRRPDFDQLIDQVRDVVATNPGLSYKAAWRRFRVSDATFRAARDAAIERGLIRVVHEQGFHRHYPVPEEADCGGS